MTETTTTTAGTALAQVAPGLIARVRDEKPFTVTELADLLAAPAPVLPEATPKPAPPKPVRLTDVLKGALRALPGVFGIVAPTERRKLEAAELKSLTEEANAIDAMAKQLGERRKDISEYVRTHMDFTAEDSGIVTADTIRVAEGVARGHWLLGQPDVPYEVQVDGYADAWQQRYVKGKTSQEQSLLDKLVTDELISRPEYLAFTREVRVLDEDKIKAFIRRNPARGLEILAAITRRSAPSASVYAPKK
jgi:hypothetical protein